MCIFMTLVLMNFPLRHIDILRLSVVIVWKLSQIFYCKLAKCKHKSYYNGFAFLSSENNFKSFALLSSTINKNTKCNITCYIMFPLICYFNCLFSSARFTDIFSLSANLCDILSLSHSWFEILKIKI